MTLKDTSAHLAEDAHDMAPWMTLGVEVEPNLSVTEFLKKAQLDWEVTTQSNYHYFEGELKESGSKVLIRKTDGKVLTQIPPTLKDKPWEYVQNTEGFETFMDWIREGNMQMCSAGSLKEGEIVWAMAKMTGSIFEVFGGDIIDPYILFTIPHQYGRCIDVRLLPTRRICSNSLTLSLGSRGDFAIKLNHRKKFDPELVKKALSVAMMRLENYKKMAEYLGSVKYRKEKVIEYFKIIFPAMTKEESSENMSRLAKICSETLTTQPGVEFASESWWQAFNAVTRVIDHIYGRTIETRLLSSWYGPNRMKKIEALELANEFAEQDGV